MLRKEGYLAGFISVFAVALFFAFPINHAQAASLYFSPTTLDKSVGQSFSVVVRVNTDGQAMNAAQGSIVFDPAVLQVTGTSKAGSIFNLWTQDPTFSNPDGTLDFEGGLPSPGYSGSSGLLLTVTFKVKGGNGPSSGTLVSGAILANDGQGTNILTSLGKFTVTINGGASNNSPPSIPTSSDTGATTGNAPAVTSSTHPDSTKWYSNNNPAFAWTLPTNATGTSYLITDKATSNPGPNSDGLKNQASFTSIADGIQYLHIKFKVGASWGPITHYQFNIDTIAPVAFDITKVGTDEINPEISFETTDALSGIDHYEVRIGDNGTWITVPADQAGKPYKLSFDRIGTQTIYVKAVDKAGNATTESTTVSVSGVAIGSSIGTWIANLFNGIVNFISADGLLLAFLALLIGFLILIFRLLGAGADKFWHKVQGRRVVRKAEHKADSTMDKLITDMADEIKFLNTIGKHRKLGSEEKYLKSKLEQYLKTLKNSTR